MTDDLDGRACCCRPAGCEAWVPVVLDPELPAVRCQAGGLELAHGERCLVETGDGQYLGWVTDFAAPIVREPRDTARVVRRASSEDEKRGEDLGHLEVEVRDFLRVRATELDLPIKVLKVRLSLFGRKAVVFFSSEQRVDFRPLLRELGRRFRRRVEMRPLGVRDAARMTGGIGPCGRCVCCTTFMDRFHSVTVRMAKRQNLSLNPTKISGLCGRLMCCLAHEVDQYPGSNRRPPA